MLYLNHILNNTKNAKIQYVVALRAADMWWCGVQSSHLCVSSFFEVVFWLSVHLRIAMQFIYEFIWAIWGLVDRHKPKTSISFFAFCLCLFTSSVHSARSKERSQMCRFATPTENNNNNNNNNNNKRLKLTEPKLRIGARLPATFQAERNAEFRVAEQYLPLLADFLWIPEDFKCPQGKFCDEMEGIFMLIRRFAHHCRYSVLL